MVQNAVKLVSEMRSSLGATQNRLEHALGYINNASENLQVSESKIRDTDMAGEIVEISKNNILQQAAETMLSQGKNNAQGVLKILG